MKGIAAFLTFLFIIPIGHILTGMAIKFSAAGQITVILIALSIAIAIMYVTKYLSSEAWETFCGLIAGVLLWASLFEMGSEEPLPVKDSGNLQGQDHTTNPRIPVR